MTPLQLQARLAELLSGLAQKIPPDELITALSAKWSIAEDEVDFYLSAIASYNLRASVLRGAQVSYDSSYRPIFKALDVLGRQGAPCLIPPKPGLLQRWWNLLRS